MWYNLPTADVKAMGRKFAGEQSSPPLKTSFIFASHHNFGAIRLSRRIFEKRVARK